MFLGHIVFLRIEREQHSTLQRTLRKMVHEVQDGVLHDHRYAHHQDRRNEPMDTEPKEEIEQDNMQHKIERMTAREADKPSPRRTRRESEIAGCEEVTDKTDQVSGYIRCVHRS